MSKESLPWGELTGIRPVKRAVQLLERGMNRSAVEKIFREEFSVSEEKTRLALDIAEREHRLFPKPSETNVSLYLDIPFCPSKCVYCSFASMGIDQMKHFVAPYLEALYREIDASAEIVRNLGFQIDSVYIGGGTPTTLSAQELDSLLGKLQTSFDLSQIKEFTVEAGRPDTITAEKLAAMRRHGADRISVNPQSMNQKTLNAIGRKHSPEQIAEAMELVRRYDFRAVNMDVIAGLPEETPEEFADSLQKVTAFAPENITVHTMCIKRAARLVTEEREIALTQDEDVQAMVRFAHTLLGEKQYFPYYLYRQKKTLGNQENTGFSKDGFEGYYNVAMMEELQTVISMGVGGVTKLLRGDRIERIFNIKDVREYIRRLDEMIERKQYLYEYFKPFTKE